MAALAIVPHDPASDATVPRYATALMSQPPVLFVALEVAVMLPRAYNGHLWYHEHFREYPTMRRAVLPYLL